MTMTAEQLAQLRERYQEQIAPKCHICGAEMTIQRAGGGSLVYGCTGRVDSDGDGYVFAEGRYFADNHYALSRVTVANNSDPDVLALLDELEQKDKRIAELEAISSAAEKLVHCKGRYHSEQNYRTLAALFGVTTPDLPPLESEARTVTVKLPKRATADKYVDEDFDNSDLAAIYNACRRECEVKFIDACAAAGINLTVEG